MGCRRASGGSEPDGEVVEEEGEGEERLSGVSASEGESAREELCRCLESESRALPA